MQYWPRKRAAKQTTRVRSVNRKGTGLVEFAGYKAGMTHIMVIDNRKNSELKGEEISVPVTVIEVPKLRIIGARSYRKGDRGLELVSEEIFNTDKQTTRKSNLKKKGSIKTEGVDDIRAIVQSQPPFKKTPELFEATISGNPEEQYNYIKENQEISIKDVYKEGDYVDVHAVTKGKGFQGPVKRFGISLTSHKSEKSRRSPGSLGPWVAQGHITYRVPMAGQTGYHQRTEYSKFIFKISENPEEIIPKGDFPHYGKVNSEYMLVKGSIPGPQKRLIRMTPAMRKKSEEAPTIVHMSTESKQ